MSAKAPLKFPVTVFPVVDSNVGIRCEEHTFDTLCAWLSNKPPSEQTKKSLPLIKLATFGDHIEKKLIRNTNNVTGVSGIEGDYDGEEMSIKAAAEKIRSAGIQAFLYTTPSHAPRKPRWRVLCPLSKTYTDVPEARDYFLNQLDEVLGGVLATESWTLAQGYFIGKMNGHTYTHIKVPGNPIDELDLPDPTPRKHSVGGTLRELEEKVSALPEVIPIENDDDLLKVARNETGGKFGRLYDDGDITGYPSHSEADQALCNKLAFYGGTSLSRVVRLFEGSALYREEKKDDYITRTAAKGILNTQKFAYATKPVEQKSNEIVGTFISGYTRRSLADLLAKKFKPREWIVSNMLTPGLTLIVGPPKSCKSYLAGELAICVAHGIRFFDRKTRMSEVLYLDLEVDEQLSYERVSKLRQKLGITNPNHNLDIQYGWKVGDEALDNLDAYLDWRPECKMVVVDIFQRVREDGSRNRGVYANDYAAMAGFLDICNRRPGLGISIVHHSNKGTHTEWQNSISGSHGLAGATTTNMVLTLPNKQGMGQSDIKNIKQAGYRYLNVAGKAMEKEIELVLEYDHEFMAGLNVTNLEPADVERTAKQAGLLVAIPPDGTWITAGEVADKLGRNKRTVGELLRRMAAQGEIRSDGQGGRGFRRVE